MSNGREVTLAGESRVWLAENGAGPQHPFLYQGCMKIGDTSWPQGDITRIECPSPTRRNEFIEVAAVQGAQERVGTQLMGRYPRDVSDLLRITRKRCRFDVQVHVGKCEDPQDFLRGWEKIKVYREARISEWGDENAGALESGDQNPTNETAEVSSADLYEIVPIAFAEKAKVEVTRQVYDIVVCDSVSCGGCDDPSDGCEKVFAIQRGAGATPGTTPAIIWTKDGGDTWTVSQITTMLADEIPAGLACVGGYLVAISETTAGLHYALIADILEGTETWTEATAGFAVAIEPQAISSAAAGFTWIVAEAGYIYFTADPTTGVEVQDPGVATTQTLNAVHAFDQFNVVAVGESNAVVRTDNGGETWQAITGPAVGVSLTAIWMLSPKVWFVGTGTGLLYYTIDGGLNWTAKALPGVPTAIKDIAFVDDTVGYIAYTVAGPVGRIARTVNGGYSWYLLPEKPGTGSLPANDAINALAPCPSNVNVLFAGGLADDANDGIIVKAA